MSNKVAKKSRWKVSFILSSSVPIGEIKSFPDIEFIVENDKDRRITGINVITPVMSYIDAVNYAEVTCNRCVDYLCFLSGWSVTANLRQMNELGPEGVVKTGIKTFTANVMLVKRADLAITTEAFQRVLRGEDITLILQLGHFRRGMLARDTIEKIREFYQVLELEKSPSAKTYKYVRHMVSHPEMTNPKSIKEAVKIIGKPYLDVSAPQDLRKLERDLSAIEKEAMSIIQSKL